MQSVSGYKLVELVGEGPRATVYKGQDPNSGRFVAVKLFHSTAIENSQKLLRLRHPHLAAVSDVGRAGSQSFTVTEYLSGGTLKDHIRSMYSVGDVFPPELILDYAKQIAGALLYTHAQGLSHNNVKAENVMFSEDGSLKLTDISIETQADSEPVPDLEAFGRLLYEIATGQLPLSAIAPPSIEVFRQDLPPSFIKLVARLLNHEQTDSYKDFRSVLADLDSASVLETTRFVATMASPDTFQSPGSSTLQPGRLLAGRFKIVRFIARGGMGDVYEAEDVELHERVALKTVRAEIAGAARAMERFKREIQLARKVTHPNVCRIFDLFHDTSGSDEITFLTMELIGGETLHQRLSRNRLTESEAMPIVQQMVSGLAAAHKAGVIHRDFKSSNVMLTSDKAKEDQLRAVVTDFGLARQARNEEAMTMLSNPADAVGTPAYMSPEQVEGGEITLAADIYALGVVIYEMVTGTLPFTGESGFAVALKRLQIPPASPRIHVPQLSVVWETTILRCLERQPAARFKNVEDVVKALTGEIAIEPLSPSRRKPPEKKAAWSRLTGVAAVTALAILIAVFAFRDKAAPVEFKSRRSVAVLGFKNLTGQLDAAWLSTALSEMLTTELAAGEKLRTIPGENVARMSVELSLPQSSSFAPDTLSRIRTYLGADLVIYGSYVVLTGTPTKIRMDLRLQDAQQGSLLATVSEEGYAADLLTLVSRSGEQLRERLGVGKLEPKEAEVARAALPATPEAARFYSDGLEKLRLFDAGGARAAFEKAIEQDGRHALARSALATSWSMLGYAMKAQEQAKIALDLSAKLSREDQLLIQGRSRETALEWRQAVDVYRTLFGFFPDNLDYGLRLAEVQTSAGDAKASLITIEKLRQFHAPDSDNPRIDLAEARAAGALSDFRRQQAMAARSVAKGKEHGATLLVAGSKLIEGSAFVNLGELNRAKVAFEEARETYTLVGDRWDAANASTNLAYVVMQAGDLSQAENIYQQSLKTYRELGDRKGEAAALTSLGTVFRNRGDLPHAKTMHEQALAIRREVGDRLGEATSRNNLANILSLQGDSQGARQMYQAALPVFREVGDRNALATVLSNLGDLVSEEGDLTRARDLYEESRVTFLALGNKSSLAHELSRLGDLDLINGDLSSARKRHEEALSLRKQLGESGAAGESQLALGQISLHEGDAASAEAAARAAAEAFASAHRPDDEASAEAVLARSLLAREKYPESTQAIQHAEELSMKSKDRSVRLAVAITAASIRATRGDAAKSIKDLEAATREARSAKLIQLELEARLATAEIEIATGRFQSGRLRLDALEMEAAKRGYKFIADRAASARKKIPALTA
jgi:serine/threonine protein kinase/tetratricopeptide (TPR) repeat protein/TolB-like protein